ncbi:MAG: manganese efflux pump MntP family protein [Coriobacteriales bacterium]|jgi:putative Mn2+ efflux pump MntP|nr:manganese efflux pump MntP family protein [Coriobacteriales bacterium]
MMNLLETFLIALSLAADAFAVSLGKGLATRRLRVRDFVAVALWFGGFQALMPLLGYFLADLFAVYVSAVGGWIAFALLVLIGANMIREALAGKVEEEDASFGPRSLAPLAVATSIDAFAVGISFALLPDVAIGWSVLTIGLVTAVLSAGGLKLGNLFGERYKSRAELAGGIILILIGLKTAAEQLGLLP